MRGIADLGGVQSHEFPGRVSAEKNLSSRRLVHPQKSSYGAAFSRSRRPYDGKSEVDNYRYVVAYRSQLTDWNQGFWVNPFRRFKRKRNSCELNTNALSPSVQNGLESCRRGKSRLPWCLQVVNECLSSGGLRSDVGQI